MKSTITFLGTGGDTAVMAKQSRATAGIVIQTPSGQFHMDPGPGAVSKLRLNGLNSRETTSIFSTNGDLLNSNDLNALVSAMTLDGLDKTGIAVVPEHSKALQEPFSTFTEKTLRVAPGKRIGINETDVAVTWSTREDSIGYLFQFPGFTLGYPGDTGYDDRLLEEFKDVNILILKVKNPADIIEQDSLNMEDAQKLVNHTKPDLCVLTGFGAKMLEGDMLQHSRTIQKNTGVQTLCANDGLRISPASYSKSGRQQTLSTF